MAGKEYFLSDALGSVRQLADSGGAVSLARSYQPYGKLLASDGSGATSYGFTGEMTDTNGSVYLRARYFAPEIGRFLTRDSWGGDYNQPLSYNAWLYAYASPLNNTDPSGLKVTEKGINAGEYVYSCHCGWLDFKHANPIWGNIIRDLLKKKIKFTGCVYRDRKVIRLNLPIPIISEISDYYISHDYVVMTNNNFDTDALALGIFMDFAERWESYAWFSQFKLGESYFSEEVLTSDIVGFYLSLHNMDNPKDDNKSWNELSRICGIPEKNGIPKDDREEAKKWSIKVLEETGGTILHNTADGDH